MKASKLISAVKTGENTETLLKLLDQIDDVEGLYLDLVDFKLDKSFLNSLFKKTKNVSDYLGTALEMGHASDYLISRSSDFKGCFETMLELNYSYAKINMVLMNATDVEGCLLEMLSGDYRQDDRLEFFYPLVAKTINFEGCLRAALNGQTIPWYFIKTLVEKNALYPDCIHGVLSIFYDNENMEDILDMLIGKNVNYKGCLLRAIEMRLGEKILRRLAEKTTNAKYCLEAALYEMSEMTEFLEILADKTKDTSWAFSSVLEYNYNGSHEFEQKFVYKLFSKAKNIAGNCLWYAISDSEKYSEEFMTELVLRAEDFSYVLKAALGKKNITPELLETIFTKTTDFEGCLAAALLSGNNPEMIERLFLKTGDYSGCLNAALKNGGYSLEFYERLLALTPKLNGDTIESALEGNSPLEFVEKLLDLVEDPGTALGIAILEGYPLDLINKLYTKTTYFDGCLWSIANADTTSIPLKLLTKIFHKIIEIAKSFQLEYVYKYGTHSLEFLRYVLKRQKYIDDGCVKMVILNGVYPIEFVDEMMEKTLDFDYVGILIEQKYPVDFIEKHIDRYGYQRNALGPALKHGGFSTDFLVKLVEKSLDSDEVLGSTTNQKVLDAIIKKEKCRPVSPPRRRR